MKLSTIALGILLVIGLAGLVGCKKQAAPNAAAPMKIEGVDVDLPKLQAAVDATGNADLQSSVRNVMMSFRYRQYDKALMDLEKLTTDPNLNDEQKKLASQVFDQVKQVVAKAPPPAQ